MGQDILSDALNQIMNSKRVEKTRVEIRRYSKLLLNLLNIMKDKGHINFEVKDKVLIVDVINLNKCRAVKPRYFAQNNEILKYEKRFLPSRNFGTLIISTNQGLIDQNQAEEMKIGGAIIAYFY